MPLMCREQLIKKTRKKIASHCFTFNKMLIINILRRYPSQQDPKKHEIFWRIIIMGEKKVKHVKLQSYRRKYEMMQMEEDQKVSDYFLKMIEIVNLMKNCGENNSDHSSSNPRSKGCKGYED